jgi:hypothetical protein
LAIAGRVPEARAVVTLATPADAAQVADLGQIGGQAQRQRIATLRRPLLVIHSPNDEIVSFGNARVIFDADHIDREMQFEGELTDEQRGRLLDIAECCPVHRTLHSEVLVSTAESVPDGPGG